MLGGGAPELCCWLGEVPPVVPGMPKLAIKAIATTMASAQTAASPIHPLRLAWRSGGLCSLFSIMTVALVSSKQTQTQARGSVRDAYLVMFVDFYQAGWSLHSTARMAVETDILEIYPELYL